MNTDLFINLADFSPPTDGVTDTLPTINAAISAAEDGAVIVFPACSNGFYVNGPITPPTDRQVNFLGGGVLLRYPGSGALFKIWNMMQGSRNPTPWIKGFRCMATLGNGATCVDIRNSIAIKVEDVWASNFYEGVLIHNTNELGFDGYSEEVILRNVHTFNCDYGLICDHDSGAESMASLDVDGLYVETMAGAHASNPRGIYITSATSPYRSRWKAVIITDKTGAIGVEINGPMSGAFGSINIENVTAPNSLTLTGIQLDAGFSGSPLTILTLFSGYNASSGQAKWSGSQPSGWISN